MSAGPAARTRTLMVAQALSLSAMSVDLTVTALASTSIAPTPILGTLPMALLSIGGVAVSGFVPRLAARIGWRTTFALGAALALGGGLLSWSALAASHFITLCIGTALVGAYQAITGYYRYVAADLTPGHEARSVARVLAAGVVAAILGPVLATASAGALEPLYSGAYLAVAGLAVAALVTVLTLPRDLGRPAPGTGGRRVSLGTLLRRRDFRDGALIALCSCFSMALIMSGAPLVLAHELHVDEAGRMLAMQIHMIGMYGPMLVLPVLATRLRIRLQAAIGHGAALLGLALSLVSFAAIPVAATLGLIGVSWAFGYASGTALLTRSYSPDERASARGRGELFPVAGLALGGFLAAPLTAVFSWGTLMLVCAVAHLATLLVCAIPPWGRSGKAVPGRPR